VKKKDRIFEEEKKREKDFLVVMSVPTPTTLAEPTLGHSTNLLENSNVRPGVIRSQSYAPNGIPAPPIAAPRLHANDTQNAPDAVLELLDGTAFCGISFGALGKSVAGECVFQTGARIAPYRPLLCFCAVSSRTR
jgi:hypothetical protein